MTLMPLSNAVAVRSSPALPGFPSVPTQEKISQKPVHGRWFPPIRTLVSIIDRYEKNFQHGVKRQSNKEIKQNPFLFSLHLLYLFGGWQQAGLGGFIRDLHRI